MNLTVGNLSSEQDRLSTTVMMILLLKYEAPARLNFISKTTTAFCVRVFCHATVPLHHFFLHCHSMTQRFKTVTCLLGGEGGPPVSRPSCIDCWVWQVVMGLECYAQITWRHNGKKKKKRKKNALRFWLLTLACGWQLLKPGGELVFLVTCQTCGCLIGKKWVHFKSCIYCTNTSLSQQIFFLRTMTGLHILKTVFELEQKKQNNDSQSHSGDSDSC